MGDLMYTNRYFSASFLCSIDPIIFNSGKGGNNWNGSLLFQENDTSLESQCMHDKVGSIC